MTNEEIKELGLREGDVVDPTFRCKVDHVADDGTLILHGVHYNPKLLIAIERVMPGLPDGWTWVNEQNPAVASHKDSGSRAQIDSSGLISATKPTGGQFGDNEAEPIPALVAKALLEVWGRTQ